MEEFTHSSGHTSTAGRVQDRKSLPARDQYATTVPRNQPWPDVHVTNSAMFRFDRWHLVLLLLTSTKLLIGIDWVLGTLYAWVVKMERHRSSMLPPLCVEVPRLPVGPVCVEPRGDRSHSGADLQVCSGTREQRHSHWNSSC